ncbi:MAG: hypothetical protein JO081_02990 [Alphaproteobacteria bacterium]|nr:hypothetical protein [Alphaproteobacteria bacterium]
MRIIVCVLGLLCVAGAVGAASLHLFPAAAMLALWAVIFLVGLAVERWRYKRLGAAPPGPGWQRTDERFVDPETGKLVTVYVHPATG